MKKAGNLIEEILKRNGIYKKYKYQQAVEKWDDIVGSKISDNSRAVKVESGVLWVEVKNSIWLHHLSMLKSEIIRKVNGYIGNSSIKDVYFFQGKVENKKENYLIESEEKRREKEKNKNELKKDINIPNDEINDWINNIPQEQQEIRNKVKLMIYKRYS